MKIFRKSIGNPRESDGFRKRPVFGRNFENQYTVPRRILLRWFTLVNVFPTNRVSRGFLRTCANDTRENAFPSFRHSAGWAKHVVSPVMCRTPAGEINLRRCRANTSPERYYCFELISISVRYCESDSVRTYVCSRRRYRDGFFDIDHLAACI